jgi:hypothetical protein
MAQATPLLRPERAGLWGGSTRQGPLSLFIGQWVPALLIFGLHNKIVKVAGSN